MHSLSSAFALTWQRLAVALLLVLAFLSAMNLLEYQPRIISATFQPADTNGDRSQIWFPHTRIFSAAGDDRLPDEQSLYEYTVLFEIESSQSSSLRLTTKGCIRWLEVNGQPIQKEKYENPEECLNTATQDVAAYLKNTANSISVKVTAKKNEVSLNIMFLRNTMQIAIFLLTVAAMFYAVFKIFLASRYPPAILFLLAASFALHCWWLINTQYFEFSNDARGHLEYIRYMAANILPPRPDQGWMYYHPPIYYLIGGLIYNIADTLGAQNPVMWLRVFSLALHFVFMVIGLRILMLFVTHPVARFFAAALVLLWPLGFATASRIDSHALFYPFAALSLYYLALWWKGGENRHLTYCLAIVAISFMVRSNALILMATVAVCVAARMLGGQFAPRSIHPVWRWRLALIFLAAIAVNMGRNFYLFNAEGKVMPLIVSNSIMWKGRLWSKDLSIFLPLNWSDYWASPFIWGTGEENFWFVFLKSAMFGQFKFFQVELASMLQLIFSGLMMTLLLPVLFYTKERINALFPFLALILLSCVGLMYNRWDIPQIWSGEFRYAYCMLIGISVMFGVHLEAFMRRGYVVMAGASIAVLTLFLLAGIGVYAGEWK